MPLQQALTLDETTNARPVPPVGGRDGEPGLGLSLFDTAAAPHE